MRPHFISIVAALGCAGHVLAQGQGTWTTPFDDLPGPPRHAVYLPPMTLDSEWYGSGLVLLLYQTGGAFEGPRLWDPESGDIVLTLSPWAPQLFCSGHAFDGWGRLVFTGGGQGNRCGIEDVIIFDPADFENPLFEEMDDGRWYPTAITDADGNVWFFAGNRAPVGGQCPRNLTVEWFDAHQDEVVLEPNLTLSPSPANYARMHLLGSAVAPGDYPGVFAVVGPQVDEEGRTFWFNTANPQANFFPGPETALSQLHEAAWARHRSTTTLLPIDLRQSPVVERVLVVGGERRSQGQQVELLDSCEILEYDTGEQEWIWRFTSEPLNDGRIRADVTLMADGIPFVVGGVEVDQYTDPVFTPERFVDDEWETLPDHTYRRPYHSVALLLRDGSVWVSGGDEDGLQDQHGNKIEIYNPWYMSVSRPEITSPAGSISLIERNTTFNVTYTFPSGLDFEYVALISLGSVTHSVNFSQRYVILDSQPHQNPNTRIVEAPEAKFVPPGIYMIVVVGKNGQDHLVPSVAEFVYVDFE